MIVMKVDQLEMQLIMLLIVVSVVVLKLAENFREIVAELNGALPVKY
jgi:hypothetical protein